jgi:hypothetical protein
MGAVLTAVAVACMGAFAFGYHLGVVNGPLEAIAKELGFLGNQALSGLVRWSLQYLREGSTPAEVKPVNLCSRLYGGT